MDWPDLDVAAGGTIDEFHQQSVTAFQSLSETLLNASWPNQSGDFPAASEQSEGDGSGSSTHGSDAAAEVRGWFRGDGEGI